MPAQSVKEAPVDSSEHLARRFSDLVHERDRTGLAALLHPQVIFTVQTIPGEFAGRADVLERFYNTVFAWTLYDAFATDYTQLADGTVCATGRLRWMSNGDLHEASAIWKLTFRDGKLFRLSNIPIVDSTEQGGSQT